MTVSDANTPTTDRTRILLADDEPDIVEPLQFCLEQEGYDVRTAGNGHEALGLARAWRPHVVLLDVMMPGENGYRVSRFIKEDVAAGCLDPTVVILVTARRLDSSEREEGLAAFSGADKVVYKPFDLDELLDTLRSIAVPVAAG